MKFCTRTINPKVSPYKSGLGIFKKASTSPTVGIYSGMKAFNLESNSIFTGSNLKKLLNSLFLLPCYIFKKLFNFITHFQVRIFSWIISANNRLRTSVSSILLIRIILLSKFLRLSLFFSFKIEFFFKKKNIFLCNL